MDNDKKAPEADPKAKGNAPVDAPATEDAGNAGKTETNIGIIPKPNELEEATYKERYANSTKEAQRLMEENKKMREKLGLSDSDSLDEEEETKEESPVVEEEKKTEEETVEKEEAPEEPEVLPTAPELSDKVSEQTAFEMVWDIFSENPKNLGMQDSTVADRVAKEVKRFAIDLEGNRVPYKKALQDAYDYVYGPIKLKIIEEQGRAKGIAEATKNRAGTVGEITSKASVSRGPNLTDEERTAAKSLGMTEEEYLANKVTE
jgi:hypothetical protein